MQVSLGLAAPVFHGRVQPELDRTISAAAGAGFIYEIGTAYYERLTALTFKLVTSAHAANRQVTLSLLEPDGTPLAVIPVAAVQAASLTYTYSFLPNVSAVNALEALTFLSPLFELIIPPSYAISVGIGNVDVGDQISNVRLYRDRFSTGPDGYPMGGYDESVLLDRAAARAAHLG